MAKVSIHCDGTDIYIEPEGKKEKPKEKPADATRKETIGYTEQELSGGYTHGTSVTNGNDDAGNGTGDNTESQPLYPYELKAVKKNGNGNGIRNNGVLILEKAIAVNQVSTKESPAEAEEKHRTIVDQIPDAYFAVDLTGSFIFVNETLCRFLGYSKDELTGTACRDHIVEESFETVYKAFENAFQNRSEVKDLRCEVIRRDGSTAIAEMSAYLLKNGDGDVAGFRCIGRDITERVRKEEVLNQSVQRYRAALDEVDEIYFEVDLSGNFIYINEAACRELRRSREEIVGMNYRCYIPEYEIERVYQTWNTVYRTGEPLTSYHYINIKKSGQDTYLENSVSPVRNSEGKITGFKSISRDVTDRKDLTQKLTQLSWPAVTC